MQPKTNNAAANARADTKPKMAGPNPSEMLVDDEVLLLSTSMSIEVPPSPVVSAGLDLSVTKELNRCVAADA
jgi:hypothetical protein